MPVHFIFRIGNYTKFKLSKEQELTKFGWVITYLGQESHLPNMLFSKISVHDYESLCSLVVLGVKDYGFYQDEVIYDIL